MLKDCLFAFSGPAEGPGPATIVARRAIWRGTALTPHSKVGFRSATAPTGGLQVLPGLFKPKAEVPASGGGARKEFVLEAGGCFPNPGSNEASQQGLAGQGAGVGSEYMRLLLFW